MLYNTTSDLMSIIRVLNHIGELSETDKSYQNISEFLHYFDNIPFNHSVPVLVKIGKASRKISDRIIKKYQRVPWKTIKDFANICDMDYELFGKTALLDLIKDELPRIEDLLEKIVAKELNEKYFSFKEYKSLSLGKSFAYVNFKRINAHLLQLKISEIIYETLWQRS
ncbi:hypothetical protein [uncultured Ilyobacter sp.]|uniref:hypothetical protein n=1 Tax=uncultured Ilyobacter sp. TaxID=544433 RepID=UPI0029C09A4C|nr:hypothetical protein [uncultured Ilyobacter sp.]